MRIIGVLFTVILFFVPSRGLTYIDEDESSDNRNREFNILPSRAAIERVPHQFERYKIHVPVRDAVEKLPSKKDPSPSKYRLASGSANVFCHLDSTQYHKNQIPQNLEKIILSSCTHVLFSSADTNFDTIANNWYSSQSNGTFASIARLKKKNPATKILLLINDILPESVSFSKRDFIISVSEVLKISGFDGLVLSDVIPTTYNEFGEDENTKEEFPLLIEELASVLKPRGWSLSLIVPPLDQTSRNYDTKRIVLNLDFIILKSFDFRQDGEKIIGHHAPLYSAVDRDPSSKYRNVDYMVKHWIHNGADPNQIIVGVALFGRSFRLTDPKNFQPGSRTNGDGYAGRWTKTSGFLSYYEVCDRTKKDDWRQYSDKSGSPFVVRKDQWISYENHHSLTRKLEYMEKLSLGGVMLWSLDSDDYNGLCGTPWPLVTTVKTYISNVNKKNSMANDLRETPLQFDLNKKVVCYFASWSWYRYGEGKFAPEYIDKGLCTHVVYAFASLDPNDLTITSGNEWEDFENKFYERLVSNSKSGDIKVMISMGGWTDSAGDKYSKLISTGTSRRSFVNSAVAFLRKYNFNGLHLDWNYPVCWQADCTQGPSSDKTNFVKLIQELKSEFNKQDPPFELSAAISGYEEIIKEAYDFPSLSEYLDFMSIMTYDYHGSWENVTGHVSPAYYKDGDEFPKYNMDSTIKLIRKLGADPSKIVVGLPFYGQTYTLSSNSEHGLGDPAKGSGYPGEYTQQPGMLAYYEICNRVANEKWQVSRDKNSGFDPYAYDGNQWVSYDDEISIKLKSEYIVNQELGGAMVWTIDLDDFNNICCKGSYPLLTKVNEVFKRIPIKSSNLICNKPDYPTTPTYQIPTTTEEGQGSWEEQSSSTVSTTQPTRPTTISTTQQPTRPTTQYITKPQTRPSTTTTTIPPTTSTTTTTESNIDEIIEIEQQTTHKPSVNRPWWSEYHTQKPEQQEICKPGTYQSSKDDCQNYYQCKNGRYRKYTCKEGLLWNRNANKCDSLRNVECNEPTNSQISEVTTTTTTTQKPVTTSRPTTIRPTPTWRPTTTTGRPITTWRPTTTTARPVTTWRPTTTTKKYRNCVEGEYVAAIGDCTSYFVCSYGYFVRQFCSAGLAWNDKKKMCDWKYNVYCNYQRSNSIFTYTSMLVKSSVECQDGEFAPHPGDCNKYLQCLWGKFKVNSCPAGLYWNNRFRLCDWPMNSGCMPSQEINTYPTDEPDIPSSPSQPSSTEPTTKPTTSKPIIIKPTTLKPTTLKPTTPTSTTSTSESTTEENYIPWKPTTGVPTTEDPWAWKPTTTTAATLPTTQSNYHLTGQYKVVCYFTNWAWYRPSPGKFFPEDTDPNLCTHVVYGFATLDYTELVIRVFDSWADIDNGFYERVVALKRRGVKVSIGLGGWNDSAGDKYSRLVNNRSSRKKFINNVLDFMHKYGFEGLDVDWEYPKCWQTNCDQGPDSDKNAFSNFLIELKQAFKPHGYLLSAAVSPSKVVIDSGYDVPILNQYLDWIGVMAYDYHGQWDKKTGHVAPIYNHPEDEIEYFNLNYTVHYWIEKGANSRKIVLGFPLYGQSFTLSNPKVHGLNAPSSGAGEAGPFTRSAGFIAYYEICRKLASEQWTIVQDPQHRMGPYAYKGNQWVGFDDVKTVAQKAEYVKSMNLGGAMIWALDLDDYRNVCGQGNYPLLSTIMKTLGQKHGNPQTTPMIPVTSKPTTSMTTTSSPHYNTSTTEVSTTTQLSPTRPTKPTYTKPTTTKPTTMTKPTTTTTTTTSTTTTAISKPTTTVKPPSAEYFKVVCYFTNWAWYRHSGGKYLPSDIDPSLCTHIIYGFAVLDNDELTIRAHDTWADFDNFFYRKVTALKKFGVKVLLAIGGWNDSAGSKYSELVNNPLARSKFVEHVVGYLKQNDFDGLDFDWEYPKCWQVDCKRGPKSDKEGFSRLLLDLREAFDKEGFLLSAAVSPNKVVIDAGYDVPLLSATLDWISVMAYDYHGQWDKKTGHVAPMYSHPDDFDMTYNANFTLYYWVNQGADPRKLIMGMPTYGQSFSLASKNNGLNAPTYGGGEAGDATRSRGFLSYYEICHKVLKRDWQLVQDPLGRMGPYAYSGNQWVSFDDQDMIRFKSEFVVRNDLGGAMIWALDLDDFKNVCGCETYPMLKTINRVLGRLPGPGPDCYLDQERNDLDGVVIDNSDVESEEEQGRGQCTEPLLKGHGTDCNKYVICEFGSLLEQSCPSNLYFNKMNMLCDWPENVNCTQKKRLSSSHRQLRLLH
ncbi:probable chitinase 10 isoform X2 [Acyrthosiphon pisum]|nr:probable chitinase 10 isoform X2 [Acyrthosiphon pisum]|eukprot:XP_008184295.1 PREDICTED: probable chitinase 3 isoform X2 [Acyrthosiphon pisum]